MMKLWTATTLIPLLLLSLPAQAQLSAQTTPEYSGPSAKFDRNIDDYRAQKTLERRQYTRADDAMRAVQNDRGFENNVARRNVVIQQELTRRAREAQRQNINE